MTPKIAFAALVAALALAACQPPPPTANKTDATEAVAPPDAGEVRTEATITAIEDAGYPMFTVTAAVPGKPAPLQLLLNAEGADLRGVEPASFKGTVVTLTYTSAWEPSLIDIRADGHSLLGPDAPKADDPAWTVLTGALSGATAPTAGDLPDTIEVTDAAGKKTAFQFFITPEIVAANGKQVTAYYRTDSVNRVTGIRRGETEAQQ